MTTKSYVLIVDDDPAIIQTTFKHFSEAQSPYHLWSALNGKEACQIAVEQSLDLIIMDWDMPVMNGLQAIQWLQNNEATRAIPIIVTTGVNVDDKHLEKALQVGAVDYLRKPFSRIELLARAKTALRLAKLHQQEKQLMELSIAHKNRELSMITVQVIQKNQLFNDIQKQLKEGLHDHQALQKAIKTIQENMRLDNSWEKFKLHFEQVHPNFFALLKARCTKLSSYELRLCAYLKMNLSGKDIVQILNISNRGVETACYRIKKKLGLSAREKLTEFVQQF
ncbi:MAG TPA: hypothetical protein DCS93_28200 [Microscillaceae bacterium]|nr:hypothetical protein [Microscillaceae bacterium]